ncbi:hypothetical protein LO762_06845 [Actinocorallia sp. API 0066]|uniref:hypothetical protein n=1 Tax=Actinocorallia sp. API 0066 TaxID=2896846 RepID=UPI001E4286CA|nr:hypothetical protein [Actinocorallia sp. API 0066]MCD0448907.1 hypothetical protein [Actinocorallia sp. API 0066]
MGEPLDAGERAELARLRAELAALRAPGGRVRAVVAAVLLTLGCLLAPFAVVAAWTGSQLSDTDRYVATVAPLAERPEIQNAVANRVTAEIVDALDVPALVTGAMDALEGRGLPKALGDRLSGLSGAVESAVTSYVRDRSMEVVESDTFASLWEEAHRAAHTQATAVLSGRGSEVVKARDGTITLDLGPVFDKVKQRLDQSGFDVVDSLPEVRPTLEIYSGPALAKAQRWYQVLNALRWILPALSLILITAGVYTARFHRRALAVAALGVVVAMLLLALGLLAGRAYFLNTVAARGLNTAAAGALYDTLILFLRSTLRTVAVLALVVALGAFLTGPSSAAVRTRAAFGRGFARLRGTGHGSPWVWEHRRLLRTGAVLLAILVFFFWNYPTGLVVLLITLVVLLALALVEAFGRPPDDPGDDS